MHPSRQLRRGGNEDEDFEALLEEQRRFAERPAATAVRVARPEGARKEPKEAKAKPKASLFKQLRQGLASSAPSSGGKPYGVRAAAPHPEIAALPELEGDEAEELGSCLAAEVSERTALGSIDPRAEGAFAAPEGGFPIANHRAVGKALGFGTSRPSRRPRDVPEEAPTNEEEAIDQENRKTLQNATPEEVKEWQQELLQQFGAETCEFLRRRGAAKQRKAPSAAPGKAKAAAAEDLLLPQAKAKESRTAMSLELTADGESLAGGRLDRAELQKLQWTMPPGAPDFEKVLSDESLPPEPAGKVLQLLRFDFAGRICLRAGEDASAEQDSDLQGLHHHGAESGQAGYTLAELLILSRSASAPQRALALTTLGAVLHRARAKVAQARLLQDPALRLAGLQEASTPLAGFGLGLKVFFWHGLARSDIPKHLAEALRDPVQAVQLAALRATAALLDGGEVAGDAFRGANDEDDDTELLEEIALGRPWDALRTLVLPSAPPADAASLAQRPRVVVLTSEGFGGSGAGRATWPGLLKRQLLRAKEEPEVTAADVLEPLLPSQDSEEEIPAIAWAARTVATAAFAEADTARLALLARCLGSAATWTPALGQRILMDSEEHRQAWIRAAAEAKDSLRVEALRFLRKSCEAGGRGAVAWWLSPGETKEAESEERWTATAVVRRAVLGAVGAGDVTPEKMRTAEDLLCGIEGLRTWLAWLRCGAGGDRLDHFAPSVAVFWQRFAAAPPGPGKGGDCLLTALLLELSLEILRLRGIEAEEPVPPLRSSACEVAAGAFASAVAAAAPYLAALQTPDTASGHLCTAALADVLDLVISAGSNPAANTAARRLLRWKSASSAVPQEGPEEQAEAPWPLGGALGPAAACRTAELRSLGAMARLAGTLRDPEFLPWLRTLRGSSLEAVRNLAPALPLPGDTEALVGRVECDPFAALFVDISIACQDAIAGDELSPALALAGCWPTAQALLSSAGLGLERDAEYAVVAAAFRPEAPFAGPPPEASGPPRLSFAAALFWALAATPAPAAAEAILSTLGREEASELLAAVPPWLPFISLAGFLSLPLAEDAAIRSRLGSAASLVAGRFLTGKDPAKMFAAAGEWLSEVLRGLCDRMAKLFVEESFSNPLLAGILWAFAARRMPPECQAVCWGGEDPALLQLLDRALPRSSPLLAWRTEDYLGSQEGSGFPSSTMQALGLSAASEAEAQRSWPRFFAAHLLTAKDGVERPTAAATPRTMDLDALE